MEKTVEKNKENIIRKKYHKHTPKISLKKLLLPKKSTSGRSFGKISIRHRGGGHKRKIRYIDFGQEKIGIPAKVTSIEYDPNRSAHIALILYKDGERRYIIAPKELKINDEIIYGQDAPISSGNRLPIKKIPIGLPIYNIELHKGQGAKFARSAGNYAKILAKEDQYSHIELPSGEVRKIKSDCFASIGSISNEEHIKIKIKKAGRTRWMGRRPSVRGKAMDPSSHPHGGGEGRNPIGLIHAKTPWGKPALGKKTRKKKKYSNIFIIESRKKK